MAKVKGREQHAPELSELKPSGKPDVLFLRMIK
jgi:hypothetical protein